MNQQKPSLSPLSRTQRTFRSVFNSDVVQRPQICRVPGPEACGPIDLPWIKEPNRKTSAFASTTAAHTVRPSVAHQAEAAPEAMTTTAAAAATNESRAAIGRVQHACEQPHRLFTVEALLESVSSGAVAPLRGSYLIGLHRAGGRLQRRQELPESAFFPTDELRRLAHALGDNAGLAFVAFSARWLDELQCVSQCHSLAIPRTSPLPRRQTHHMMCMCARACVCRCALAPQSRSGRFPSRTPGQRRTSVSPAT